MWAESFKWVVRDSGPPVSSRSKPAARGAHLLASARDRALIVIGGNGSQTGATPAYGRAPVIGVASTIDNDLCGTDISIGATTAVDVALEAIDRLRVTARRCDGPFWWRSWGGIAGISR